MAGYLIALILAGISGLGAYFYGVQVGKDSEIAHRASLDEVRVAATEAAASAAADAIAKSRPRNTTIRQETEREIRTNTVYADCRHSPEQLQRINEALTGKRAESAGSGVMP